MLLQGEVKWRRPFHQSRTQMATLNLKGITKIYPHSGDQKKAKKKKGEPEKKTNLQVTEQGVIAVQQFNLDIADKEFIVLVGPSEIGRAHV